jgi:D-alanine-D-alanine ligase-like ATP-grasp enzyme
MKIILTTILLTGCAGFGGVKEITLDNALKECKYFKVNIKHVPDVMPELTVNIVGQDIEYHCGLNAVACLKNGKDIYLRDNDWMAQGHETCHAIDTHAEHTKEKPVYISIEKRARAQ